MTILNIQHISKSFGDHQVLNNITLRIEECEAVAFIGINGSGKSTTLRIIAGIDQPDSGRVRVSDIDITHPEKKAQSRFGYVPDIPFLYEGLTGREYLSFLSSVYRTPLQNALTLVTSFSLDDALDQLVMAYSHGMRHKLALIGALFYRPSLLLLDEPFTSFDTASRENVLHVCQDLLKEKSAIFFSTHDPLLVQALATRVIYISQGTLTEYSTDQAMNLLTQWNQTEVLNQGVYNQL